MSRPGATLEWQILDDETYESNVASHSKASNHTSLKNALTSPQPYLREYHYVILLVLACLIFLSLFPWYEKLRDDQAKMASLETLVKSELATIEIAQESPQITPIEEWLSGDWGNVYLQEDFIFQKALFHGYTSAVDVHTTKVQSDLATVSLHIAQRDIAGNVVEYRQIRFYRYEDEVWTRSIPDSALWGVRQFTQTNHFAIHYREEDIHVIKELESSLDDLYIRIYRDFNFSPLNKDKLEIEIVASGEPSIMFTQSFGTDGLIIPSPQFFLLSDSQEDSDVILNIVASAVARTAFNQAIAVTQDHSEHTRLTQILIGYDLK